MALFESYQDFPVFISHPQLLRMHQRNWFLSAIPSFGYISKKKKFYFLFSKKSGAEDLHDSNDNEPLKTFFMIVPCLGCP
jgi:hypothetical protein